jgi:RNA polymerase sigma-70 factor (ECF subfamily)
LCGISLKRQPTWNFPKLGDLVFKTGRTTDRGTRVEALYREYGPAIHRRCLRLLGDRSEAQEMTQEVFIRAFNHLDRIQAGSSALPWLYEIATRLCINHLRNERRHALQLARVAVPEPASPQGKALLDRELASEVLSQFDERTGVIALYALVDGMTQEEVAKALGLSRRTVGTRLRQFLERARAYLEKERERGEEP